MTLISETPCYVIHSVVPTNSPQGARFAALLSVTHRTTSTLDVTTLPVICSNTMFQEAGYPQYSALSLPLRRQT